MLHLNFMISRATTTVGQQQIDLVSVFIARIRGMRESNIFTGICLLTGVGGVTPWSLVPGPFPGTRSFHGEYPTALSLVLSKVLSGGTPVLSLVLPGEGEYPSPVTGPAGEGVPQFCHWSCLGKRHPCPRVPPPPEQDKDYPSPPQARRASACVAATQEESLVSLES